MATEDKFLLLKMHPCSEGLSDNIVRQISEKCELLRCESGQILHRANEAIDSVYLVIHGRLKQSMLDIQGHVILERDQIAGTQVGALAAASCEPTPLQIEVMEPTTLLRVSYRTIFELSKTYDVFRQNLSTMIAQTVNSTLMGERRKKLTRIVAIIHQSPETMPLSRQLLKRLHELGQRPFVFNYQSDWQAIDDIPHYSLIRNGRLLTEREVRQKISELPDRGPIVFDVDAAIELESACNIIESAEMVFWCVTPDNWRNAATQLGEIEQRSPSWRDKINIVWLLPGSSLWAPRAPELVSLAMRDFKLSFDEPPKNRSNVLATGLERIIHEIRGVRIGLALGGGAARGMAHLGVLKALEANGLHVDMIAGTSAGAMTGILYASGMKPQYTVDCFLNDLALPWLFRQTRNGGYWYLLYKYRSGQFDPMLRKYLHDSRLEQLPIPVYSVSVDLISGQPIVCGSGDSVHAITESINLPIFSVPINREGRALVDGGVVNNVPANVLVSKGCNFVIAVSVTAHLKEEFASNRPDTPTSNMKSASTLQTILRMLTVQNVNLNSVGVQPADFVIEPDVSGFDLTAFSRADQMSATGEQVTLESIPKLKLLLSRMDGALFGAQ